MTGVLIDWETINNIDARFNSKAAFIDKDLYLYIFGLGVVNLICFVKRKGKLSMSVKPH